MHTIYIHLLIGYIQAKTFVVFDVMKIMIQLAWVANSMVIFSASYSVLGWASSLFSCLLSDSTRGCKGLKVGRENRNTKFWMTQNRSQHCPCPPATLPLPIRKRLLIGRVSGLDHCFLELRYQRQRVG